MTIEHCNSFNSLSLPLILPKTKVICKDEELTLSTADFEYSFNGKSAGIIRDIIIYLNGNTTVESIVYKTHCILKEIIDILDYLYDEGLVIDISVEHAKGITGSQLVHLIKKEVLFWRKHINNQPFWRRVHAGLCTEKEIKGWGIEFYHYVEAANEYMASGVAYCRESIDVRQKLSAQYAEEANHSKIFLDGLSLDGIPAEFVTKSFPLSSTRALINFLNETSIENTLVYSSIFVLMQSDGTNLNIDTLKKYYGDLIQKYPFAKHQFLAYLKHASIDAQLGHQTSLFEKIYDNNEIIATEQVFRVFQTIRQLTQYFILFYDYISEYYSKEGASLPRRAPKIADFHTEERMV